MRVRSHLRAGGYGGGAYGGGGGAGGGGGGGLPAAPTVDGTYELLVSGGVASWLDLTPFTMGMSFAAGSTYEVGASVVNPVIDFTYTSGVPASAEATHAGGAHSPYVAVTPYTSVTCNDTFTSNVNGATIAFGGSSTDTASATASAAASLLFAYGIAWGYSTAPAATQAQYNALAANHTSLSTTRSGSYNYNATTGTQYCTCAIPAAFGTPTVKDQNGFIYVPTLVGTAIVTNAQGLAVNYNFYVFGLEGAQATFTIS